MSLDTDNTASKSGRSFRKRGHGQYKGHGVQTLQAANKVAGLRPARDGLARFASRYAKLSGATSSE